MAVTDGITLEQTILGHALNDSICFKLFAAELGPEQFAAPNHKVMAFCLKRMAQMGVRLPDEDTFQLVVDSYPGEEDKDYGGTEYIRSLKASFAVPTDNFEQFVTQIKLQAVKHSISTKQVAGLITAANDPTTTVDDIRAIVSDMTLRIEGAASSGYNFVDMIELGDSYLTELEERTHRPFATTGLVSLDEHLTEGFAPKKITVMAGFTGMAKSTVAINMAHRIACGGVGSAMFSMETTGFSLMDKMVSTLSQIAINDLKKNPQDLSPEHRGRIESAVSSLRDIPLLINDQASVTIDSILYQIEAAQRRGFDPKVIFIDLFGKLEDVDTGDNIAARVQKEMKRMRVLAKMLNVHFVCVVQVGRSGFGRGRGNTIRRPTLIDIKNANAYAEEADLVLLLHRNMYYLPDLDDDILEIDIAKQRDGENEKVYFEMFATTSTIMETDLLPHDVNVGPQPVQEPEE